MTILGDLERFVAEELYPYRWPITIGLVIALAGAVAFGWRRGWHRVAWRHKLATGVVAAAVLAVAVPAGDYFLSPLWERSFLEEASPLVMDGRDNPPTGGPSTDSPLTPEPTAAPSGVSFQPRVVYEGEFMGADDFHFGRGKALLIETATGVYTLRFEEFSVRNGPDLFVYLSPSTEGKAEGSLKLGALKATDGAFNYDVPAGTDLSGFKSAIVWCDPFSVLFAVAPLAPAR
jgi:hypothetical protein